MTPAKPPPSQLAGSLRSTCTFVPPADASAPWECYCGLGPNCTFWHQMNPTERAECSRDKRMDAEYRWKNGHWTF